MIRSNLHPEPTTGRSAADGRGAAIALRSTSEIESIRATGAIVSEALDAARDACVPGATTSDIARAARNVLDDHGAEPLALGAAPDPSLPEGMPFPEAACISVEDVVMHGVPGDRILLEGEIVGIDVAARHEGWCADAAITVPVGRIDDRRARLVGAVEDLLETAIDLIRPGVRWSAIARVMQDLALGSGYGLVEGFAGHGIGRKLHESPPVPSQMTLGLLGRSDFTLRPGMVLAIEPSLVDAGPISGPALRGDGTAAGIPVTVDADGWSIRTLDGAVAAHAEHTVAVGRRGARVLTRSSATALSPLNHGAGLSGSTI